MFPRIVASVGEHGQVAPIVVRQVPTGYEVVDGMKVLRAMEQAGAEEVDIYFLGEVDDGRAREIAIALLGARGEADKAMLAESLEALQEEHGDDPDETARLGRTLPFRTRDLAKLINRLRGNTTPHTRRRASSVEFRFRVPPEAGPVISQAIESVVVEHEVTRDRALELICADFNAGVAK